MPFCSDSVLKNAVADFKRMGQRIFVFIIGGATSSEVKLVLDLSLICFALRFESDLMFCIDGWDCLPDDFC